MVCLGVDPLPKHRRSYFIWREKGIIPSFICEFSSENTWRNDLGDKFDDFERIGIEEYFLFDPEGLYLKPALQGWRLVLGVYQRIEPHVDGSVMSEVLGWRLIAVETDLRPLDPQTGEMLPNKTEHLDEKERKERELELALRRAEKKAEEHERAEKKAKRAEDKAKREVERAKSAEEKALKQASAKELEIERLKALLAAQSPSSPETK